MTDEDLARVIFCAVNECDPVEEQDHVDAAFEGRRYCDGAWISAHNARIAATAARAALEPSDKGVPLPDTGLQA
jgi:hypothetical protein